MLDIMNITNGRICEEILSEHYCALVNAQQRDTKEEPALSDATCGQNTPLGCEWVWRHCDGGFNKKNT